MDTAIGYLYWRMLAFVSLSGGQLQRNTFFSEKKSHFLLYIVANNSFTDAWLICQQQMSYFLENGLSFWVTSMFLSPNHHQEPLILPRGMEVGHLACCFCQAFVGFSTRWNNKPLLPNTINPSGSHLCWRLANVPRAFW